MGRVARPAVPGRGQSDTADAAGSPAWAEPAAGFPGLPALARINLRFIGETERWIRCTRSLIFLWSWTNCWWYMELLVRAGSSAQRGVLQRGAKLSSLEVVSS